MGRPPILVLGATSLIGRFLTPRLAAAGRPLVGVSRQGEDWLRVDLTRPEGRARLPEAETVLSLSPVWLLPEAIADLKARGMRRLVAFSSTSVVTKATSTEASERTVVEALARGEEAVRASGVDWTLLRPTMIYAEGLDGNVSRLASLARRLPVLPIAGRGEGRRQPVHADDLATAALQALDAPAAVGRTYELAGGETLTYREMCGRIFEGLGRSPRILSVPPPFWRLGLRLASPLLPGATGEMGARMDRDLIFDDSRARADFGWTPRDFRPRF